MEKCNSIKELFGMLESSDSTVVEEIKVLIHESLNNTREPWLLNALVDYYVAFQSERCLDIVVGVREPHDKFLFDKLAECLKGKTRPQSLMLLGHVVRKQPSWLYKIATHKLFTSLLHVLKTDTDIPNLMSALLILVTLLPVVPASIGPFLQEIFDIFSRLAAWNTKKPSNVPAVFLLHLQVGLYSLFHRLYAMYPCNFLAYLRSCYGHRDPNKEYSNRDTLQVFTKTIKPMLERVRLHPLLVTASKDGELTTAMWKKMEMHDIIVECAKLSLDVTEGAWEEGLNTGQWPQNQFRDQRISGSDRHTFTPILSDLSSVVGQLTSQYPVSKGTDTPSAQDVGTSGNIWSPSHSCGLATPPVASSITSVEQTSSGVPQTNSTPQSQRNSPPLDVAIEATPDNPLRNTTSSEIKSMDETQNILQSVNACLDYEKQIESVHSSFQTSLTSDTSEDAKEDEAADKEVSDIVDNMTSSKPSNEEAGQATPFLSTTRNLTCGLPAEKLGYENEIYSNNKYNENHLPMEQFFRNMSRLRYFSQCGQPPDIPAEWVQESKSFKRAQSCPSLQQIDEVSDSVTSTEMLRRVVDSTSGLVKPEANSSLTSRTASSSEGPPTTMETTITSATLITTTTPSTTFVPVQNVSCSSQTTTEQLSYEHLFSLALKPLPHLLNYEQYHISGNQKTVQATEQTKTVYSVNQYSTLSSTFIPEVPLFTTLSPPEVLDRHLQFGSDIYLKEVSCLPLPSSKNTNWTHFGGQAPIDEINILRGQVSLLHSQLLYERHKREIHAERNRRLLGKAKRTRALEEQNVAMKDQLHLIEKESQELFHQLNNMQQKVVSMENDKNQEAQKLQDNLKSALEENERLNFSNRELQQLLVSHKQENDFLKKELQKTQAELFEARVELSSLQQEAAGCEVLRKEVDHLRKELTLYGEVHLRLRKQVEASRPKPQLEQELELMQQAAAAELKNFKEIFNTRSAHLEFYKSALHDLEKVSATKDTVINEQKSLMETLKQTHADQIKALEKRIYSLHNICQQLESHIMELYEQIDKNQFTTPRILDREHTDFHSLSTARSEQVSTITNEDGSSQRDLITSVCQTTNGTTIAESNLNNSEQSMVSSDQSLWSLTQSVDQELYHHSAENPDVENSLANSHFLDVEGPVTTDKCPQ
ncbi:tuberous sclerosis 1 protein hamartin [Tachypleus tridentatus]|uniref:tuberous sclerosis 1 protein hamartin n=1 Tax=Tachypleus tridentatus TaxID=6853 RepID=UPI003FD00704